MRLLLPIILLLLGGVLITPLIDAVALLATAGAPDASAISIDAGSLIRLGIGALLMIAGVLVLIVRNARRNAVRSS